MAASCLGPTLYGQTTRAVVLREQLWPPQREGNENQIRMRERSNRPLNKILKSPKSSPSTVKHYRCSAIRPTHAFLPTVTLFRPHSCRFAAAKRRLGIIRKIRRVKTHNPPRVICSGTDCSDEWLSESAA